MNKLTTTFYTHIFTLLIVGLLSSPSIARNEGRWYQVELLIFKRLGEAGATTESWRQDITLEYPENSRELPQVLAESAHQLGGHHYTLNQSEQYKVLFHRAWKQQMWGRKKSPALIIRGGQRYGQHRELEGTIKIHIGRYLHVSTDLWLSRYLGRRPLDTTADPLQRASWLRLPALPGEGGIDDDSNAFLDSNLNIPSMIIPFREKRRMKSKETHYIDHPLMGIFIHMVPLS